MNKLELENRVARELNITGREARAIVEIVINSMSDGLVEDGRVILKGLGIWRLKKRSPRLARNIQTGEVMSVPGKNTVAFEPSKEIVDLLNRGRQHKLKTM